MKRVGLVPQARRELRAAMRRYERERAGLGLDLAFAVDAALTRIGANPQSFPRWNDERPYRKLIVPRFNFLIFYRERDNDVLVLAIAHPKRRPGYWLHREL